MATIIRETDSFATGGRGSPNALSPASNGDTWVQAVGSSTPGFVGNAGTLTGSTSTNVLVLGPTSLPCIDLVAFVQPAVPQDTMGVVGRYNSNGGANYYRATCQVVGGNATFKIQKVVAGGATTLTSMTVSTATAGFWIHFQISDLSAANLNANYWLSGQSEPAGWMLSTFDQTSQLLAPGQVGIVSIAIGASTTQRFSSFTAKDVFSYAPPPAPSDLPYALTLHVPTGAGIPFLTQQTMNDLLTWHGQGFWLRYQHHWSSIEPNANQVYNWSVLDYAVSLCNSAGIRILWPVQDPPAAYQSVSMTDGSTNPGAPTGNGVSPYVYAPASAWATFVTAAIGRYNGTVASPYTGYPMVLDAIQLENEQYDSTANTPRDLQSQWLVAVATTCYPIVKQSAPDCLVGLCAVRKTNTAALTHITNWVTNLYTYNGGIGGHADFLDFHYYRDTSSAGLDPTTQDANTPSVATELATILSIANAHGHTPKIACFEFGWNWYNASTDVNLTDSQVSTASQITQYTTAMFDALRTGGGWKGGIFTSDPGATVTVKNLQPGNVPTSVSSVQKSMTQIISNVYTYEPTWTALQAYFARYPIWPTPIALFPTPRRRGGTLPTVARRLGMLPGTKRRQS